LTQVESRDGTTSYLTHLDPQALYGSPEVPGSLLVLAPGKTALIRVPAQWSANTTSGREAVLAQPGGMVRLRATFSISTNDLPPLIRSENAISVTVVPRQLR
jgi:hypothetical protein